LRKSAGGCRSMDGMDPEARHDEPTMRECQPVLYVGRRRKPFRCSGIPVILSRESRASERPLSE
jgi:hypothetical protein